MIFQCPGAGRFKEPYPEAIICGACGREAEIWSDEIRATCFNCGVNDLPISFVLSWFE